MWQRVFNLVAKSGMLSEGERDLFAVYCDVMGTFNRACDEIKKTGFIVRKKVKPRGSSGVPSSFDDAPKEEEAGLARLSPWYQIKRNALADVTRCAALLGLTPVDRSRVVKLATENKGGGETSRPRSLLDGLRGPLSLARPDSSE